MDRNYFVVRLFGDGLGLCRDLRIGRCLLEAALVDELSFAKNSVAEVRRCTEHGSFIAQLAKTTPRRPSMRWLFLPLPILGLSFGLPLLESCTRQGKL
jgi:hypothetical protein